MTHSNRLRGTFATDAGMLCVWRRTAFKMIRDHESWEQELLEDRDILRYIRKGDFVPIYIRSDGAFEVEVRLEPEPSLSERELRYVVVSSKPYLFCSSGDLCLSGLEHVSGRPSKGTGRMNIRPGNYAVMIHLIAWDKERGSRDKKGKPRLTALPDFVVLMRPEPKKKMKYRTKVDTFDQ